MQKSFIRKPISVLLSLLMVLSVFGGLSLTAQAYDGNPYASLVNTTNTVEFNGIAWYVIEDNSTAVDAGTLTLLARDPICASVFNNGDRYTDNIDQYNNSVVRTYLDGLTTSGSFTGVSAAIVPVDLPDVNVTGAKLWLLSPDEVQTIFNTNKFVLTCTKADGVTNGLNYCWTRTAVVGTADDADHIVHTNHVGYWDGDNGKYKSKGMYVYRSGNVRPALKLDLSKVTLSPVTVALSGGANATTTGGGRIQRFFELDSSTRSPIVTVYYNGGTCGTFPATSENYTTKDGITVEYVDSKTLKVSGTPTEDNVNITIPDAIANHNFGYTASGATITAGCKTSGCPARSSFNPVKLTIAAPTGNENSKEATLTNLDAFNGAANLSISTSDIKYYNATKNGDVYTKGNEITTSAPAGAGDYIAEITVFGATASVGYTIVHTHAWDTAWSADADYHWHACTGDGATDACLDETEAAKAEHTYGDTGDARFTCTCGYVNETLQTAAALADAKIDAKADLDALLDGKTEADYDAEDWAALTQAITDGKAAIDTATTIDDVTAAKTTAIQNAPVIKTTAEKLADAKTAAKADLDALLDGKTEADYDAEDWAALTQAITDGKAAIDTATTIDDVTAAKTTAIQNAPVIKTTAEKLADAKTAALEELQGYAAADAYREAQQITLADALATGYGEIDEAETIAEVEAALAGAKEVIDAIKTDAELTAEEEAAAAEAAANQAAADAVKEKIAAIGEVEYTDDSKAKIDEARAAYDALTDAQKALVDNADVLIAAETAYAEAKAAAETPDEPTEPEAPTKKDDRLYSILSAVIELIKVLIIKIIPGIIDIVK